MDILRSISEKSKQLSRGQREVAQYFIQNWEKAAYESTTAIALQLGLSQSTIIRTAVALGFAGFPQLQNELRQYIQFQVSSVSRLDRLNQIYQDQSKSPCFITRIFETLSENLQGAYRQLQQEDVYRAVKLILAAEQICLVGMRSSASVAHYLGFNLSMILKNVSIIANDYCLPEHIRDLSSKDLVIAIAFPRYTRQTVTAVRAAWERKAKVIAITDSLSSPLADCCDLKFLVPVSSAHFNNSPIAAIALSDVILAGISLEAKQKVRKELQKLEQDFETFRIFSR